MELMFFDFCYKSRMKMRASDPSWRLPSSPIVEKNMCIFYVVVVAVDIFEGDAEDMSENDDDDDDVDDVDDDDVDDDVDDDADDDGEGEEEGRRRTCSEKNLTSST